MNGRYEAVRARLQDEHRIELLNAQGEVIDYIKAGGEGEFVGCQMYDFLVYVEYVIFNKTYTEVYNVAKLHNIHRIGDTYSGTLSSRYLDNPYELVEHEISLGLGREKKEEQYSVSGSRSSESQSNGGGGLKEKFWGCVCIYVVAALALCAFYDYCIIPVWNYCASDAWQLSDPSYANWVLAPLTLLLMILNWIFY